MRRLIFLAAILASAAALGQMRQYGDSYAGNQETVRQLVLQNQLQANRSNFSAPAYRVEQQIWRPSTPSYSPSSRPSSRDSGSGQQAAVFYEPEPYLVPFGNPGSWRPPSSGQSNDMWSLYLDVGGDPARAVAMAQAQAETGNTKAMLLLALAHKQGRGLPADEAKALGWLQKAADAGEPHAALYFARALIGTGRADGDYGVALRYFQKAESTLPEAGLEIGLILAKGQPGVVADPAGAVAAFEHAAGAGDATSQYLYAICLQTGTGVARNPAAAIPWLQKASDRGLPMAQLRLGETYYFGDGVPTDYRRALALLEQADAANEPGAANTLGLYYSAGVAAPQDYARAAGYFRKGAEQGDPQAQLNIGSAYSLGNGVPADDREAARWLTLAADAGNSAAQYLIGMSSLGGFGVPLDVAQGVRRLQQSAAGGFAPALDQLCDLSMRERSGIRMDTPEFTSTLAAGTAENQPACLYVQASRLMNGIQGPKDSAQAFELLKRAAEGGYSQAELDYGRQFLGMVGHVDPGNDADLLATAQYWLTLAAGHGSQQAGQILVQQGWR